MTDLEYMRCALYEAQRAASEKEIPVGAVLVYQDTLIAASHNRRENENDPTAHAEVRVLQEAARKLDRWRLTDCTLYVTIEPCTMCAGAILNARISRLVYGADDPKAGAVRSLFHILNNSALNHRVSVRSGLLEKECRLLMQSFFTKRR